MKSDEIKDRVKINSSDEKFWIRIQKKSWTTKTNQIQ